MKRKKTKNKWSVCQSALREQHPLSRSELASGGPVRTMGPMQETQDPTSNGGAANIQHRREPGETTAAEESDNKASR